MNIFLIRHWESIWNISKKLKFDSYNLGLTKKWINEIIALKGNKIIPEEDYIVFSSPYIRAIQTANILFSNNWKINIVNEFRELDKWFAKSRFKNYTWDMWNIYYNKNITKIANKFWRYSYWESLDDLYNRVIPKFINLVEGSNNKNVIIVTHNWVIKILLWFILETNIWYENLKIRNWSVIEIQYKCGKYSIIL